MCASVVSVRAGRETLRDDLVASRGKRRKKEEVVWTRCYRAGCTSVALAVGFSPLMMVGAHTAWLVLQEPDPQDDRCSYTPLANRSTTRLVHRGGDHLALLTSADEGPRSEYRRMARLSLSNKRAYAVRHHYSLYTLEAARPECMRRSPGWFKLLALEEQVRLRSYEWLLWMDADTFIMEPAIHITSALAAVSGSPGSREAEEAAAAEAPDRSPGVLRKTVVISYDAGLNAGMLLLPGRWVGSACLLQHAFAMRRCLPREETEAGLPLALLGLLQTPPQRSERCRACAQQHAPACSGAEGRVNYSVLPSALFAPLADYRPGDFAVHLAGCIGRRQWQSPKPLRQCEQRLNGFANLSLSGATRRNFSGRGGGRGGGAEQPRPRRARRLRLP